MYIKESSQQQYDRFCGELKEKAFKEPQDASYSVSVKINDMLYNLKIQPGPDHKLVVLQALRYDTKDDGGEPTLIKKSKLLSALLEIVLSQGVV